MRNSAITIFVLVMASITWWRLNDNPGTPTLPKPPPPSAGPEDPDGPPAASLPCDQMLENYGTEDSSPKNDLVLLGRFIDSAFLIIKNRDTREYATNEDLVLFLQGHNAYQSTYLGKTSPALNDKGQLIDRWGSPIIIHPVSQKILELRSAGPDQKPYTGDDLKWPGSGKP